MDGGERPGSRPSHRSDVRRIAHYVVGFELVGSGSTMNKCVEDEKRKARRDQQQTVTPWFYRYFTSFRNPKSLSSLLIHRSTFFEPGNCEASQIIVNFSSRRVLILLLLRNRWSLSRHGGLRT